MTITISILGLDQFTVGHYSKEHSANLAQLFEIEEDNLNFYVPNSTVFHKGVEQNSWHVIVIVRAPRRFEGAEEKVASYIFRTLLDFTIGAEITFQYYDEEHWYHHRNEEYPLYLDEGNIMNQYVEYDGEEEDEDECEDEDCECHHHHHEELDPDDEDSIYLGDAFEGKIEDLEEKYSDK